MIWRSCTSCLMTWKGSLVLKLRWLWERSSSNLKFSLVQTLLLGILLALRVMMIGSIRVTCVWRVSTDVYNSWRITFELLLFDTPRCSVPLWRVASGMWVVFVGLLAWGLIWDGDHCGGSPSTVTWKLFASDLYTSTTTVHRTSLTIDLVKTHLILRVTFIVFCILLFNDLSYWVFIGHHTLT